MALGEFELIARYFSDALAGRTDVVLGVGDDAALLRVPEGRDVVVAADTIVSGTHFPADTPPDAIGYRALAVNLSDLAAMGATPAWCTLALTLPRAEEPWLQAFASGLIDLARQFDVALIGGDTTRGPLTVTVQVLGHVARGREIRRSGARLGDAIYVSGTVGDAAAGLALLQSGSRPAASAVPAQLVERFLHPSARVALGLALVGVASAAIDVSDGLLADLEKLVAASGVGAHVDLESLPLSPALRQSSSPAEALRCATTGGDDYELCFTVPATHLDALRALEPLARVPLTRIGTIESTPGIRCSKGRAPVQLTTGGFDHFGR
jgi:thiamine-monophosphate kinase